MMAFDQKNAAGSRALKASWKSRGNRGPGQRQLVIKRGAEKEIGYAAKPRVPDTGAKKLCGYGVPYSVEEKKSGCCACVGLIPRSSARWVVRRRVMKSAADKAGPFLGGDGKCGKKINKIGLVDCFDFSEGGRARRCLYYVCSPSKEWEWLDLKKEWEENSTQGREKQQPFV